MSDPTSPNAEKSKPHYRFKLFLLLAVFGAIAVWGVVSRLEAASDLEKQTKEDAIPTVAVLIVQRGPVQEDLVLPGTIQAWHEAPIFARTSGYLKDWVTDIGARVKAGDLLAEIETPEVDAQLHQAEADLATAEANNKLSQSTNQRWQALLQTHAVAKQDADEKAGDAAAKEAAVASARANLDRLQQMEIFKRVTAPFDGTITARNTDTGALINAGSSGTGPELFHIAETDRLRVYVQVPEANTQDVTPDLTADLHLTQFPQRTFTGKLASTADALDPLTRTLLVEFEVDNDKGELLPGSYVEAHLRLPSSGDSVHIPVNTLLFRAEGLQVAVIDKQNKAQLKTITIGRDYGKEVEVTSGLSVGDVIIVNPPDSLNAGQEVRIAAPEDKDAKDTKNKDNKDKDNKDKEETGHHDKHDKSDTPQ